MFENAQSFPHAQTSRFAGQDSGTPDSDESALRAMNWNELIARLNAAREVRLVLRRDANRSVDASASSFADAAARYFRTKDQGERDVNPNTLEHSKGSPGMIPEEQGLDTFKTLSPGQLETGDAREV